MANRTARRSSRAAQSKLSGTSHDEIRQRIRLYHAEGNLDAMYEEAVTLAKARSHRTEKEYAYMVGHRDARNAAAEIANEADQQIADMTRRLVQQDGELRGLKHELEGLMTGVSLAVLVKRAEKAEEEVKRLKALRETL